MQDGFKKQMLEAQIVGLLFHFGPMHTSKICRTLNKKHVSYCSKCRFYANPRKRRRYFTYDPDCKFKLPRVTSDLKKLVKSTLLRSKEIKITDVRQPRLWDKATEYELNDYIHFDSPPPIPITEFMTNSVAESTNKAGDENGV